MGRRIVENQEDDMNRGYGKVGINESGCPARPRLDVGASMMLRMRKNNLGFAVK